MTSRPVQSIIDAFPRARWDLDDAGDADIAAYVAARLAPLPKFAKSLSARLTAASAGNFMVAKLLTDFAEAHPDEVVALTSELEASSGDGHVWAALDEVYSRFLRREFGTPGESPEWTNAARPVLGTIAVARQKLLNEQIEWLLEPDKDAQQAGVVERALPLLPAVPGRRSAVWSVRPVPLQLPGVSVPARPPVLDAGVDVAPARLQSVRSRTRWRSVH